MIGACINMKSLSKSRDNLDYKENSEPRTDMFL